MSVRIRIFAGISLALLTIFSSYASAEPKAETTTKTVLKFEPNSQGAYSVASWLEARKQEGQYTKSDKIDSKVYEAFVSAEIVTASDGLTTNSLSTGGTTLPTTGTPGQQITITNCLPGNYTETTVYVWTCDSSGSCHWQQISYTLKMNKSVDCGL